MIGTPVGFETNKTQNIYETNRMTLKLFKKSLHTYSIFAI